MGRPKDCNCLCECQTEPIIIDTWRGSRGIPIDWRGFNNFISNNLHQYRRGVLIWAVCCTGTGGMVAGTRFCVQQGRYFECTKTAPSQFGIATSPELLCSFPSFAAGDVDLMPLAIGLLFDGQIRKSYGQIRRSQGSLLRRRDLVLRETINQIGSPFQPCGDGNLNDPGTELASGAVHIDEGCPLVINIQDVGDLEYSLVVLRTCCDVAAIQWWNVSEDQLEGYFPDTNDALHIDDVFCFESQIVSRPAVCRPQLAIFDAGANNQSHITYPIDESDKYIPNISIDRLKGIYDDVASYWGRWAWTTASAGVVPITSSLDQFDLSRVEVIWLGSFATNSNNYTPFWSCATFVPGTLDPLRDWLGSGNKLLVLDWGNIPNSMLSELGLSTAIEPILTTPGLCTVPSLNAWGTVPGDICQRSIYWRDWIAALCGGANPRIAPQIHPFTTGLNSDDTLIALRTVAFGDLTGIFTYVPVITPSANGVVIGRAIGDLRNRDMMTCAPINYPAAVVEPYPANPTSRVIILPVSSWGVGTGIYGVNEDQMFNGLSVVGNSQFLRNLWDYRNI